ncbi:helix-turn-helix transcriptional regulator [Niveibacterium sp. SC-1]|uniref:helix-turn-helix domain-containing protein n=1 Tax=Niveibacterium sp. SC-1 TaxID=3135646 RepID=UPI00311EBF7B
MAQALDIVDLLKAALKGRGLTYADLAEKLEQSESSVKRWFSQRSFTLQRIDAVCAAAGIDFAELTGGFDREARLVSRLSEAQEREIVSEPRLFLAALGALNLLQFEDMLRFYKIERTELIGLLAHLDRIGFIDFLPNNRVRLRVARSFSWIPNGPIMQAFKNNAADYFASDFAGAGETMLLVNGRLSPAASLALVEKLRKLARDFTQQHWDDGQLPLAERVPISLLVACRSWAPTKVRPFLRSADELAPKGQGPQTRST